MNNDELMVDYLTEHNLDEDFFRMMEDVEAANPIFCSPL